MNISQPSSQQSRAGLLWIVVAAVMWGTVGVATKAIYGLAETNPLSIGFLRLAIAAPALLLACWYALGQHMFRIDRRAVGLMALIGLAMALYQVCYFAAIPRVGVSVAVLVALCTAPIMVALLSAGLLGERLTLQVGLALVCALAGTVLLVGTPGSAVSGGAAVVEGVALALGAGLSYAVVTLCSRALAGRYHPLQPIAMGFSFGAALMLPFALLGGLVLAYPPEGWALLVHLGLLPTALAYLLFLVGLRSTTATAASIATLIEPLTSTILAVVLFREQLGPLGWAGAALLLGAMGVLYMANGRSARPNPAPR